MVAFTEWYEGGYGVTFRIKRRILEKHSKFQKIEVYETDGFGKMLVIDGAIQFIEKWERMYHEILVHPVMLAHPNPRNILIIGGGDGGALREVLLHDTVEKAKVVEIDKDVVDVAREYTPIDNGAFDSERSELIIDDGIKFVKSSKEKYDVIIVDSTDPKGPAEELFNVPFYKDCYRILNDKGLMVTQSGGAYFDRRISIMVWKNMREVFDKVHPFFFSVIGYAPCWGFSVGVKGDIDFLKIDKKRGEKLKTEYYDPKYHERMLFLPRNFREMIENL